MRRTARTTGCVETQEAGMLRKHPPSALLSLLIPPGLYLPHANSHCTVCMYIRGANTADIREQTWRTNTRPEWARGSQLPFETFWCVNKHLRAFWPNKTNFQSSTNTFGPIATLAFLLFRGTAQLICHHKSWPRDPAKISQPLQALASGERDERET